LGNLSLCVCSLCHILVPLGGIPTASLGNSMQPVLIMRDSTHDLSGISPCAASSAGVGCWVLGAGKWELDASGPGLFLNLKSPILKSRAGAGLRRNSSPSRETTNFGFRGHYGRLTTDGWRPTPNTRFPRWGILPHFLPPCPQNVRFVERAALDVMVLLWRRRVVAVAYRC